MLQLQRLRIVQLWKGWSERDSMRSRGQDGLTLANPAQINLIVPSSAVPYHHQARNTGQMWPKNPCCSVKIHIVFCSRSVQRWIFRSTANQKFVCFWWMIFDWLYFCFEYRADELRWTKFNLIWTHSEHVASIGQTWLGRDEISPCRPYEISCVRFHEETQKLVSFVILDSTMQFL